MEDLEDEGTVMGYPVYEEQRHLLPVSTAPPTTAAATTAIIHNAQNEPDSLPVADSHSIKSAEEEEMGSVIAVAFIMFFLICLAIVRISSRGTSPAPNFVVESATIYPFNVSSSNLTTDWVVNFSVTNPNYELIYCEDAVASIFYRKENISSTMMEYLFFPNNRDKILVQANISVSSTNVNSSVADAIVADWFNKTVIFDVIVNATARIDPWNDKDDRTLMTVSCEEINVFGLSSHKELAGKMLYGPKKCNSLFIS